MNDGDVWSANIYERKYILIHFSIKMSRVDQNAPQQNLFNKRFRTESSHLELNVTCEILFIKLLFRYVYLFWVHHVNQQIISF